MKINVEVDLTPAEFRKLLGWPDVETFQNKLLDQVSQQMDSGAEGYDPLTLLKPFMAQSAGAMDIFNRFMGGIVQNYGNTSSSPKEEK
ncbi:MAG: hypothetical protein GY703_12430 [Gammaproteobacteria bacterium]|nr:hypothetical protein [Gammaproteobacteria bacterium]